MTPSAGQRARRVRTPKCPIRDGEPCSLCFPGATGPQDCGLVYLVQSDDELLELKAEMKAARKGE